MKKFNKGINLKIAVVIISIMLLSTNLLYSSNNELRPPIGTDTAFKKIRNFMQLIHINKPNDAYNAIDKLKVLEFSVDYPEEARILIRKVVAFAMEILDYQPREGDKIGFEAVTPTIESARFLLHGAGTDTGEIGHPKVFVLKENIDNFLSKNHSLVPSILPEALHAVETLWRNRVYRLTELQQNRINMGQLKLPEKWKVKEYYEAPFVKAALVETIEHFLLFLCGFRDSYGKEAREFSLEGMGYIDLFVGYPSWSSDQIDPHNFAYIIDGVIKQKMQEWGVRDEESLIIGRRLCQLLMFYEPRREKPVSTEILRLWQELHTNYPNIVSWGDVGEAIHGRRRTFEEELREVTKLIIHLDTKLSEEGILIDSDSHKYLNELRELEKNVTSGSVSGKNTEEPEKKARQNAQLYLRCVSKILHEGSAAQAIINKIQSIKSLTGFYIVFIKEISSEPQSEEARNLLRDLSAEVETLLLTDSSQPGQSITYYRTSLQRVEQRTLNSKL